MISDTDIKTDEGIFRIYREGDNPRICVRTTSGGWRVAMKFRHDVAGLEKAWRGIETRGVHVHTNQDGTTVPFDPETGEMVVAESSARVPVPWPALAPGEPVAESAHPHAEMTEVSVAVAVSAQWQRAADGLREIIKFGALMIKIDRDVLGTKGRNQHSGKTLKGWLSEHCPEINYNTAKGYKDAALGLAAAAELPDTMPLLAMMEGDEAFTDDLAAAHERMMQVLGTASIGFLKAASRRGGARIGAGRPCKDSITDAIRSSEEALRCARRLLDDMRAWAIDEDGLGMIPDDVLDKWLISLGDVMARGRDIQKGRKSAATRRI